jgi:hypothetical protein
MITSNTTYECIKCSELTPWRTVTVKKLTISHFYENEDPAPCSSTPLLVLILDQMKHPILFLEHPFQPLPLLCQQQVDISMKM